MTTLGATISNTTLPKNNFAGTAAPTANEDTGDGYEPGSIWVDTTNDKAYVCLDATLGAAVWGETTQTIADDSITLAKLAASARPQINYLMNGGFNLAVRQTVGTDTTIADNSYGPDRWKCTRENAALQYSRQDGFSESGITARYFGRFTKITNAGKFMIFQPLLGQTSAPLRGRTVIFQVKMKASSSKTIRMAIMELQNAGTMDSLPTPVSSWNADTTDPTFGTNLAVITAAQSKSVTTSWQNFSVSVTVPSNSKNIYCALWTNADFSTSDTLSVTEAGLYDGSSLRDWLPLPLGTEVSLAQRFCYRLPADGSSYSRFCLLRADTTSSAVGILTHPTTMRAVPTLTYSALGDFFVNIGGGSAALASMNPDYASTIVLGLNIATTTATLVTDRCYELVQDNVDPAYLVLDADI